MTIHFDDTENETPEYAAFVDKFKPKKTTDDCYTPDNVYQAVRDWAVKEYGLEGRKIIRPFWPGGDYERAEYPGGCVVIDNPPFSILSKICRYYEKRGVAYFLFAPSITLFSVNAGGSNYIITNSEITYENGARVKTAFVTNLGFYKIQTRPDLYEAIKAANDANTKPAVELPKYSYPDEVAVAAILQKLARYELLQLCPEDCVFVRALDAQREQKKAIYGGGFLLREKAAAEKEAAEKTDATRWTLSARERALLEGYGRKEKV